MKLPDGCHLTYCTSIHADETWDDLRQTLAGAVPAVKRRVSPDQPFGVGLRISRGCLDVLEQPEARDELKRLLAAGGLYVFTLNGFPYGDFHRRPVKEAVYRPDWSTGERLAYTDGLADLLAGLLPDEQGLEGSISTVPLGQRGTVDRERAAELLSRHVAHLVRLREVTGRTIALALEPEPGCEFEKSAEAVAFIQRHMLATDALRRIGALAGVGEASAEAAVRRHLGVCLDLCHAAVAHEDADAAVEALEAAGIKLVKMQVTAGLRARGSPQDLRMLFAAFDEDVYLHQVTEVGPQGLRAFPDLPEAIAELDAGGGDRDWRVHYHVPVYQAAYGRLASTQEFAAAVLRRHACRPLTAHLEVETYTWSVLPADCRDIDAVEVVCRELDWVRGHLADEPGRRP